MSRLIDVDKLPFEKMEISATSGEWCVRLSDIEFAPTVDAVEVVRCVDCKHSKEDIFDDEVVICAEREGAFLKDFFCADGERKTGGA